jgi:hypothetical protein
VATKPFNGELAFAGNGNMITQVKDSRRAKVDALHAKALESGGTCDGPPGLRPPEEMGYCGVYICDPEENKLCVFNMGSSQ